MAGGAIAKRESVERWGKGDNAMNTLQEFIQEHPYVTDKVVEELVKLDRLCQLLVRCGGCRFMCAAQDVQHLVRCIEAGGDYVRDVSFPPKAKGSEVGSAN